LHVNSRIESCLVLKYFSLNILNIFNEIFLSFPGPGRGLEAKNI